VLAAALLLACLATEGGGVTETGQSSATTVSTPSESSPAAGACGALARCREQPPASPSIEVGGSAPDTPETTSTSTSTANPNPTPTATVPDPDASPSFLDRSHAMLEHGIFDRVAWFDRMFADDGNVDFGRNDSALRWQNEVRLDDDHGVAYRSGVRIDLRLPQVESWFRRWRIIVYAENLANQATLLAEDPSNPALSSGTGPGRAAAELRYDVFRAVLAHVDLGGGIRMEFPPGAFVRSRFRSTLRLSPITLGRVTTAGFFDTQQRLGNANQLEVEQQLGRTWLLRWNNVATITQVSRGWEWGTEAALMNALSATRALSLSGGLVGFTEPRAAVKQYRVALRVRRDAWRRWVFVEAEPDISWIRDDLLGTRRRVLGLTFRLEVHFEGNPEAAR